MKRFIEDFKKYRPYAEYASRADLKAEVAGSYLNWVWWILEPLMFMLVYTFISMVVFQSGEKYFPIFVFIGLTFWDFFHKTMNASVEMVRRSRAIVTKVYIPKYVLIIQKMMVHGTKMLISLALVGLMMFCYRVPVNWHIIYLIPVLIVLLLFTFGASCIMLHFGVFIVDLQNIINILLRLVFYLSGIFYSISNKVPEPYSSIFLAGNPIAMIIDSARSSMLYADKPRMEWLFLWGCISFLLVIIGIRTIYKYENSYIKVMK